MPGHINRAFEYGPSFCPSSLERVVWSPMGGPALFTPLCLPLRGSTPQSAAHTHGVLFQTSLGPTTSPHTQETQGLGGGLFLVPIPSLTVPSSCSISFAPKLFPQLFTFSLVWEGSPSWVQGKMQLGAGASPWLGSFVLLYG